MPFAGRIIIFYMNLLLRVKLYKLVNNEKEKIISNNQKNKKRNRGKKEITRKADILFYV